MIDNPLPDQVMQEMDAIQKASDFEDYCKSHAIEIAKHYDVYPELHDDFAEYYHDYMSQNPHLFDHTCVHLDSDYIDDWWDEQGDIYDDYISPYKNFDPTPDGDSPYSDAEYIITPEERNRMAFESKRESHGRGNPFNW